MPHPRNAGYVRGDNWQSCPVCGFDYRASDFRKRWDGLTVCKYDWEARHPQDFLQVSPDQTRPAVLTGVSDRRDDGNTPVCPARLAPVSGRVFPNATSVSLKFGTLAGVTSYAIRIWRTGDSEPTSPTAVVSESPYIASNLNDALAYRWSVKGMVNGAESQNCGYSEFMIRVPIIVNDVIAI